MKKIVAAISVFAMSAMFATTAFSQMATPSKEHKILKMEEGTWNAKIKNYMGPAGPVNPPMEMAGKETNEMVGDFWIVSEFTADFGGMPFSGRGQFGYDPARKKFVGSWIDSSSPNLTHMEGTYDAEKKTMTYMTVGVGMDGKPMKGKNVVVYNSKDKRTMMMWVAMPGQDEMVKVMDIEYTRAK